MSKRTKVTYKENKESDLIKLGSRSSKLATWQANHIQCELGKCGVEVEIVFISTEGDQSSQSLREFGGQGAFTKRIQQALLEGEIDFAVHSLKDLPTEKAEGLILASVPEREDALDVWVSNKFESPADAGEGARIGTGSLRRQAQLLHRHPGLVVEDIRGNVDTRLRKLDEEEFTAIVLAKAGLTRLGLDQRIRREFSLSEMLPAIGQGALGLECRSDDRSTIEALRLVRDANSHDAVLAERSLLRELRAGCLAPVGAHANVTPSDELSLTAAVLSQDGAEKVEGEITGPREQSEQLGVQLAHQLIEQGADQLLNR